MSGDDPGDPLFIDTFDYAVARSDAGGIASGGAALTAFQAAGWSAAKRLPTDTGARGWLYTTTSITGYSGQIPGLSGSGRMLCIESLPTSSSPPVGGGVINQTDSYLKRGDTSGTKYLPANHWIQFWLYINDYGAEQSRWSPGSKFIYPSPDGNYSVPWGNLPYELILGRSYNQQAGNDANLPELAYGSSQNIQLEPQDIPQGGGTPVTSGADFTLDGQYPTNRYKLGSNLLSRGTGELLANRWYLVKFHCDTSGSQGTIELWVREMNASFTKRAEWIGNVTTGFGFPTSAIQQAGCGAFQFPSTTGRANDTDTTNYDSWRYIADFCVATSDADLPTYGSY